MTCSGRGTQAAWSLFSRVDFDAFIPRPGCGAFLVFVLFGLFVFGLLLWVLGVFGFVSACPALE